MHTLPLDCTAGACAVNFPRAPRLPSDLQALSSAGPDRWVVKVERAAQRERAAFIQSLISDSLAGL
jgi:hypothetical protein